MMRQVDQIRRITIGEEFRVKTPNDRIYKVRSDFSGTPIYIRCTSGTGIVPPDIMSHHADGVAEIHFQQHYLIGQSYSFTIEEQSKVVKTYEEPPVKKSIAGLQYFRAEIEESQDLLNQSFYGNALSFDQSFYNRTLGQIVIQHKLEEKYGKLNTHYTLFSGAGFGSLQMFSCALGISTEELHAWYTVNLYSAIRRNPFLMSAHVLSDIMSNRDSDQLRAGAVEKQIRHFFKARDVDGIRGKRDLTIKECKSDVYLPLWDMSRKTIVITKQTTPDFPIYAAACMSVLDPLYFRTSSRKRYLKEMGVMNVDIVKNNDVYLKKYNQNLNVDSIGAPVRCYNKGVGNVSTRSAALQILNIKHDTDLDWSRSCGSKRYECNPVDELYQFPKRDRDLSIAQKSGDINV